MPRSPTRPCRTTWPTSFQRAEPLRADPLSEVVQGGGRQGLGQLLPLQLHDLSRRHEIPTFSTALAAQHADRLKAANDFFARAGHRPGRQAARPGDARPGRRTWRPARRPRWPGSTARQAITALWAKVKLGDRADQMAALRKLALRITWDGQSEPAVWCPLGDFFGTAPGVNLFKTLPMGMTEQGFYSYWYMPFAKSAVVELVNEMRRERTVEFEITRAAGRGRSQGLGYFHTKWHRDTVELPKDRWPDWIMLRTQGRGRFCGVMLHVWNPRGGWWGEGDEKFFVDGEKFPSTFGTGSEDYFGYAWCNPNLFQKPYHCQTMTQDNRGHQSVARWHIVDNVPFQKSFEACIEKYYPNTRGTLYACTVALVSCPRAARMTTTPCRSPTARRLLHPSATRGQRLHRDQRSAGRAAAPRDGRHYGAGKWKNDVAALVDRGPAGRHHGIGLAGCRRRPL